MTRLARLSHVVAAWLLIVAAASVVPTVRWCSLTWDQVRPEMLLTCAALGPGDLECPATRRPEAECRAAVVVAKHDAASSCDACRGCGLAPASGVPRASGCGATDACAAHASSAWATHGAAGHPRAPRDRTRAYCLGDPGTGRALRAHTPLLRTPAAPLAILAAFAPPAPQPRAGRIHALADARPPTRIPDARPPIRGPPSAI